jgi:hypothetical protein
MIVFGASAFREAALPPPELELLLAEPASAASLPESADLLLQPKSTKHKLKVTARKRDLICILQWPDYSLRISAQNT